MKDGEPATGWKLGWGMVGGWCRLVGVSVSRGEAEWRGAHCISHNSTLAIHVNSKLKEMDSDFGGPAAKRQVAVHNFSGARKVVCRSICHSYLCEGDMILF